MYTWLEQESDLRNRYPQQRYNEMLKFLNGLVLAVQHPYLESPFPEQQDVDHKKLYEHLVGDSCRSLSGL